MKAITKDFLREIKNTRSRFISILILIALAVAFLSGLRATAPDMKRTLDNYMDESKFMDIQVLATLGITDEDIDAITQLDYVAFCEGAYLVDAVAAVPEGELVVKLWSLPEKINKPALKEGRLPETADECAVEANIVEKLGVSIGDVLILKTEGDFEDVLTEVKFTVVGIVGSPYYIGFERGNSGIGTGSCEAFLYLSPAAFDMDFYTAAFVLVDGAAEMDAFQKEYEAKIEAAIDEMEPFGEIRAALRSEEVVGESSEKIDDAQKELDDAKQELEDARIELADARKELDDGWRKYFDGEEELADAKRKLAKGERDLLEGKQKYADGKVEFDDAVKKYEDAVAELADGRQKLEDAKTELAEASEKLEIEKAKALEELKEAEDKLKDGEEKYDSGFKEYWDGKKEYDSARANMDSASEQLAAGKTELDANAAALAEEETKLDVGIAEMAAAMGMDVDTMLAGMEAGMIPDPYGFVAAKQEIAGAKAMLNAGYADYEANKAILDAAGEQLDAGWRELREARRELADARKELDDGWQEYNDGLEEFNEQIAGYEQDIADGEAKIAENEQKITDGEAELADAAVKLADAEKELADAEEEIADAEKKIADGKKEVADGEKELADALQELSEGEEEYADGFKEYNNEKAEAEEKIAEAEGKLADARRELADIEESKWYVMDRDSNPAYLVFGQDADRMANLAHVFPMLFFLVAALVCLTTMTRMVEDQRTQIGCLKALGYSRLRISMKYIAYGALPAVIGSAMGLAVGYTLFPKMIFTAYQIMYDVPDISLSSYPLITMFSVYAALATTVISTLVACLATLRSVPAQLMRPRAPRPGKRVMLEYIKPLWKRMSFFAKVSARNLFRYKKRFWMTVIGIGGCTALIIAAFGLRTSLFMTMDRQFDEIYDYNVQISLSDNVLESERERIASYIAESDDILFSADAKLIFSTGESDAYSIAVVAEVIEPADIAEIVRLKDYESGATLVLGDDGVIIDRKLSELLKVDVGDSFTLEDDGYHEVKIAGVTEHYLGHFAYMTPAYYESVFGEEYESNTVFLRLTDCSVELCDKVLTDMMKLHGVAAAVRIEDARDTYIHSMERIDFVVMIVIFSAAALAVVVLYNLSNINITERKRELATIKVLGFYDMEVSQYVYRENVVLTLFGILLGVALGKVLHTWLVRSVEINQMMFGRDTDPMAFVWAALLTLAFSFAVNLFAHRKLQKIDMVESLKSAE
ncbi:MAG TPA: hypothetical protein PLO47_00165 [Bacillota bacterium]|nr:hypothetical protein [Bacillota bacterium]